MSGFTLTGTIHLTCTNQVGNVTFEIPCQGDTILFPNFQPGAAPAVTNLDDVKLDAMRAQFGETVASQANPLTRGEFLKIIIDSAGVNVGNVDMTELNKYSDVDNTTAYAAYVAYASKNRIVSGYSDGTFRPTGSITRDEAAKILMKSTKTPISRATPHTFADIEASNTLGIYVQAAYDSKLVNGINTRDGQLISGTRPLFAPKQTISKGELFKIVYNILHAQ